MDYKDEWLLLEADDDIDEMEHREPRNFYSTGLWPAET